MKRCRRKAPNSRTSVLHRGEPQSGERADRMSALGFVAKQDSERQSANVARGQGETETDQGPVDLGPGERARQGWRALDFRAKRDRVAMKAGATSMCSPHFCAVQGCTNAARAHGCA